MNQHHRKWVDTSHFGVYGVRMGNQSKQRSVHLVDVENLARCPLPTWEQVVAVRRVYRKFVGPADHVIVASNHRAFETVGWAWPDARHLLGSGKDGADLALLEVLSAENIDCRFSTVCLASGDGIFAEPVARLGAADVSVTVISRLESLSLRLRLAAHHVIPFLPDPGTGEVAA